MRPAELAGDVSRQADVAAHAARFMMEKRGHPYDAILCLQPTSPLRKPHHIDEAVAQFFDSGADSLISLKEQDYPPWWMFLLDDQKIRPAFEYRRGVNVFDMVRQQFPSVYRPNGAIYVTWTDYLMRTGRLVNIDNCAYYLMPDADSVSIDTALHFATAEAMVRLGHGHRSTS
jgi:N-acylneuraminate cytidylyltransferase/CMP-N,N'-diacetyllegionaminic acid synthase